MGRRARTGICTAAVLGAFVASTVALADPAPPWSQTVLDPAAYDLTVVQSMSGGHYLYDWTVTFKGTDLMVSPEYMDMFAVYDDSEVRIAAGTAPQASPWKIFSGNTPGIAVEWMATPANTLRLHEGNSISFWASFIRPLDNPVVYSSIHIQGQPNSLWVRHKTPELPCLPLLGMSTLVIRLLSLKRRRKPSPP